MSQPCQHPADLQDRIRRSARALARIEEATAGLVPARAGAGSSGGGAPRIPEDAAPRAPAAQAAAPAGLRAALERPDDPLRPLRRLGRITVWDFDPACGDVTIDDCPDLLGLGGTATLPLAGFAGLIDAADRDEVLGAIAALAAGGPALRRVICPARPSPQPLRLEIMAEATGGGTVSGVLRDVTATETAVSQREAIIREMDHRVKNLFTQVSAMLRIAARRNPDSRSLAEEVGGRIQAMARSHALATTAGRRSGTALDALLGTTLAPYGDARIALAGPAAVLPPDQVVALSLILHELATNAFKHGVLGPAIPGRLEVGWRFAEGGLALDWAEIYDAPRPVRPDGQAGCGSVLIEGTAAQIGAGLLSHQGATGRIVSITLPPAPAG